jgi:spermidine synthase
MEGLFYHEPMKRGLSRLIGVKRVIYSGRTRYQRVDIVDTEVFGRMLFLDGISQLSTSDEHIYHESLVHPALLTHPRPERVLIIGGGDGGALEEVLKYRTIREAVMVDIDEELINLTRRCLWEVNQGAFDDHRVRLLYMDGRDYVDRCEEAYDAVVLDLTDPLGPSKRIYTLEAYRGIKELIGDGGILVTHAESPYIYQREFLTIYRTLSEVYHHIRPYGAWIPSLGPYWMFITASDALDPKAVSPEVIERRLKERGVETEYYTPELHQALFTLPKNLQEALSRSDVEPSTDEKPLERAL